MKVTMLLVLMLLPFTAFASSDSNGFRPSGNVTDVTYGNESDDIVINIVNTIVCNYAPLLLGLGYDDGLGSLMFVCNSKNILFSCNPDNGNLIGEFPLDYTSDPDVFGFCTDDLGNSYFNDFYQVRSHLPPGHL
jgi:hypothetical protein